MLVRTSRILKLLQRQTGVERAQRGIVYVIDKISRKSAAPPLQRCVGRRRSAGVAGVAEHCRSVPPQGGRKHPQQEFLQFSDNLLFICGKTFPVEKIISSRFKGSAIGFGADVRTGHHEIGDILIDVEPGC